jgi:hypothetical protein
MTIAAGPVAQVHHVVAQAAWWRREPGLLVPCKPIQMRIRSHYRTPARRLLPALLTLVYAGVLTGGLFAHMVDEGEEVRNLAAVTADRAPGEPIPAQDPLPDDLDCMLCQVMGSPPQAGPEAPSVPLPTSFEAAGFTDDEPARAAHPATRQARAPPLA